MVGLRRDMTGRRSDPDPEPEPVVLDAAAHARAVAISDAIQASVARRPDLAVSTVGIGLDLLTGVLRTDPDSVIGMASWLVLAIETFDYIVGEPPSDQVTALLDGTLQL